MKYVLNVRTGTLHLVDGCCHSKHIPDKDPNWEKYATEDDALAENTSHTKKCKICFKGA